MKLKFQFIILFFVSNLVLLNAQNKFDINIPFQKFILKNGLTVIISEDHSTPTVSIDIWYHVGSKNEKPGRTGFAHLFEHLMFQSSRDMKEDYLPMMQKLGASNLNGSTNKDRTNFYETVPTNMFDQALWMESDRMGYLLEGLTQAKLDEQRGVVQNEKRQKEDQPYGVKLFEKISKSVYPAGHPYSWETIGSMKDLNAASLDDVKEWFKTYYGPSNATIVIVGDVKTKAAYKKVNKYFGEIPPGPPVAEQKTWIAKLQGHHVEIARDRVPQPAIIKKWNVPEWGTKSADELSLFARILSSGKSSPLYKKFVYNEQVATSISASVNQSEIGSQFTISAYLKSGQDIKKISNEIDEEVNRVIENGFTKDDLQKIKTQYFSSVIQALETDGRKAEILAECQTFGGDPAYYKIGISNFNEATTKDIQNTAKKWLTDNYYEMRVIPFPDYRAEKDSVDRTKLPPAGKNPEFHFPKIEETKLSNGLKVLLAERHSIPMVYFNLVFNTGHSSDRPEQSGLASLAMSMLTNGTKDKTSIQISDDQDKLGARLGASAGLDNSSISLIALKANLNKSLDLYNDILQHPSFPQKELDRLKKQYIAGIKQQLNNPAGVAGRIFAGLLLGKEHPYALPSGTQSTIKNITRDDIVKYYDTYIKPNNATLVIAGDITMDEIKPELEKLFKDWKPGDIPETKIKEVKIDHKPVVYILDKPGTSQSVILAGNIFPHPIDINPVENYAIRLMNDVLGGVFTSRINQNLRENKHWAYGAGSGYTQGNKIGERIFIARAPVQIDKTKEAMIEIDKELAGITSTKPVTRGELERNRKSELLKIPGLTSTIGNILKSISAVNAARNLSLDYISKIPELYKRVTLQMVNKAAREVVRPKNLVWLIVGDRSKIEAGIRSLNFGDVKIIDENGNVIK